LDGIEWVESHEENVMLVGVPKEIKVEEYRVGLTPVSVHELVSFGHKVIIETNAGLGIGFTDEDYRSVGASIVDSPNAIYQQADMVVKVKEPQLSEYPLIREGQILFTYLHLAPDLEQTEALMKSGCVAIAYETVTNSKGGLPLLFPMSQVAGRLSVQAGSRCLEKPQGGRGILLGGVAGVSPGHVVVIGGGVVGENAIRMAVGRGTEVTVLDRCINRLNELDVQFGSKIKTLLSTKASIEHAVTIADLVIGAVLVPGKAAPKLVTKAMLANMKQGSVMVDVAIDQGGCFETSRPTTHANPTYVVDNVVHYCVTNMPGAVPRTSTLALNNATLPFVLSLANKGYQQALKDDNHLLNGLNVHKGHVTYEAVARDLNKDYMPALEVLH
jgi:alanine dehydrogenase